MTTFHPIPDQHSLDDSLDRAQQTGDAATEAALLLQLGGRARAREEFGFAEALYAQAWDAARRSGDLKAQAEALTALVESFASHWGQRRAIQMQWILETLCADVATLYERLGDMDGQARLLILRADILLQTPSTLAEKIALYEQAVAIYEQTGNLIEQAQALTCVGKVYKWGWQRTEATDVFERAILLYEEAGNPEGAVDALEHLMYLYQGAQQPTQIHYHKRALAYYEMLQRPLEIIQILSRLGDLSMEENQNGEAVQYFTREVALHEQYGESLQNYSIALRKLGGALINLKEYTTAKTAYLRSLSLTGEERESAYVNCLLYTGVAHALSGDLDAGRVYAQQAFVVEEEIRKRNVDGELIFRVRMYRKWAETELMCNQPEQAREILRTAIALVENSPYKLFYSEPLQAQLATLDNPDSGTIP